MVSIPLFLLILSGLELARYAATIASMRAVVDEAVRGVTLAGYANLIADRAACNGLGSGTNLLTDSMQTYMMRRDRFTLTVNSCTTTNAVTTVAMTARYNHTFLFSMLSARSGNFEETATAAFN
ncbi:MAG: hypothetical protein K2X74_08800 [Acetobacteraceae bacterium]|nr:hypothetical protein [Acetobacteraceae bacterium]